MATSISLGPAADRRAQLARRIRLLVAATITYNVIEAIVAILLPRRVLLWPLLSRRSQIGPDSTLGSPWGETAGPPPTGDIPAPRWCPARITTARSAEQAAPVDGGERTLSVAVL